MEADANESAPQSEDIEMPALEQNAEPPQPTANEPSAADQSSSTDQSAAEEVHQQEISQPEVDPLELSVQEENPEQPLNFDGWLLERGNTPPLYGFEVPIEQAFINFDKMDMAAVLHAWDEKHAQAIFDPVPTIKRLAEIFEHETEIYMRKDPDPFDERHPYRTDPSCQFGFLLKQLFRKDIFMNKLVNDYLRDNYFIRQNIQKSSLELNILACRLILVIMPGLETSAVFQAEQDNLLNRLYSWAEDSIEPLQSYATGLLAAAMEVSDIAVTYREVNQRLVPKMIKRLHMLQAFYKCGHDSESPIESINANTSNGNDSANEPILPKWMTKFASESPKRSEDGGTATSANASGCKPSSNAVDNFPTTSNMSNMLENSRDAFINGSTARCYKMYISVHPPTSETSQMLIMRYLTSMGEYQEFLGLIFEHNAMQLIFGYIVNLDRRDTCLAFEALKYLASLLCHKKFALEFIAHGGLELLLKVPRPSIAATGVSITLYYLAYCEDAMDRICTMPKPVISQLVRYALWILGRSYDSGKCHATMFFGLSFQFKVILDEFDAQDGLRKLYNVISILKILNPSNNDEDENVNEDVECASRQLVRHVCVALKRYMESHLFYKYNNFMRQQCPTSSEFAQNITKAAKANMEQISEQVRTLQENTSVRLHWSPVDELLKLGGISLLLKIIAFSYEWNSAGRSEMVRSALDVLSICCVIPRVCLAYCDRLDLPDHITFTTGICSILGAAAGDITADADVQKSALAVLCHCICAPLARKEGNFVKCFGFTKKTKHNLKYHEELLEKVWASVCSNNGIIVLLSLMQIKVPITDADCIRGMACRALAGLARSERVRQIVGKLPLFASGQIQTLMRDPILQEKRAEHVIFQKYALELLECLSGKTKPISKQLDASLANIHKANVVAQTKIQYNDQQLFQLIYDHLESKGLSQTASMLQKEAGLQVPATTTKNFHQSPFDYKVMPNSTHSRNRLRSRIQEVNSAISGLMGNDATTVNGNIPNEDQQPAPSNYVTPIKLVKKSEKPSTSVSTTNLSIGSNSHAQPTPIQRSLQKQISSIPDGDGDECGTPSSSSTGISLSTIVTEYLTNQHALCNNPMTTCPQFDLFTPHKCPDPKPSRVLSSNMNLTARLFRAQSGYNTRRFDRRFVHSNIAPWRTMRSNDYNDVQFTCCDIVRSSSCLLVGTQQGEAKAFNMNDGSEQYSAICHSYLIDSIKANRAGDLVLTSCTWRSPLTVLWSIETNEFASKLRFDDEFYCEFSNLTQDKILGTQNDTTVIYDIASGNKISTLTPTLANQYTKNRATFCPRDELILSDGVLWDFRSGQEIHKFDKLNQTLSGVFHPNGLEIIANTEVWDLRTFHLLQTVPVLDQCYVKFSPMNVIYAISLDAENRSDFDELQTYDTSFKVLDAFDYSSIATIDVKRNIYDLSVNGNGSLISLVENQPAYDSKDETFVKIYAVGLKKDEQQEEEDEEEPDSEDGSSDGSDLFEFSVNDSLNLADRRLRRRQDNEDGDGEDEEEEEEEEAEDEEMEVDDDDEGWINIDSSSEYSDDDEEQQNDDGSDS